MKTLGIIGVIGAMTSCAISLVQHDWTEALAWFALANANLAFVLRDD